MKNLKGEVSPFGLMESPLRLLHADTKLLT
jgi:hypothetical protein